MAISAPTQSSEFTSICPYPPRELVNPGNPVYVLYASMKFTAAGFTTAAAGDISLLWLPAGSLRILNELSYIYCPDASTNSDLDIGVAAYTNPDGTTTALDGAGLADSLNVGTGPIDQRLPLPVGGHGYLVNSLDGAAVVCSFDTANSPATGYLYLKLVYQRL